MGKGDGENPPQKFVSDQFFCQLCIFVFMGVSITLSSLSAGMDNGGSFPFPYFISGFLLGIVLLVNLASRWYVVRIVQKKGLTRKNILDALNNTTCGTHIWPWSCRVGMLWCISGSIVTGIGGVNCRIDENKENNSATNDTEVKNTCYYNIEGENAELYKGLAIGLVVMHALSFAYLMLSHCPADSVIDQIKEDPRGNTVKPANNRPAAAPAAGCCYFYKQCTGF
ncbi:uncharacterized protein LOC123541530 isoform X3 [Mercenaria mercenaria]|uniref:uncharacterized protein LOC123541530 isoform X3 n=1 Tax=Mercenaria mercenaria TaxID=6596 RepID=UPI00234EEA44|nr:uncharacterized protein LOC123541530 isoform X3 [Mercenaria mercenaria]XP_045183031.2 uncharacterized protein LOC123541530 isoform X3 [Mercenaria mercenaria]